MVEYRPWSIDVLNKSIQSHKQGKIATLDLELTAKCTGANCIYCDSKPDVCGLAHENELDFDTLRDVIIQAKDHGLKWVYTCGLGEPLEDTKFWNLIHLLKSNDIGLSMFSNGVFIKNADIAKELKDCNVNIVLKMDTFNETNFDKILGSQGIASKVYSARDYLLSAGYGASDNYTDLAFSIVPTSYSIDGIEEVVRFAEKNGIFPSIGELEQAGNVINNNLTPTLGLTEERVKQLKLVADSYAGGSYMRPICPCILTGIHIDNIGNCIVDTETGLNCKWFLLKEPQTTLIGNVHTSNVYTLFSMVNAYREKCFLENHDMIMSSCNVSYVFGGCGGNPVDIINLVEKNYE